MEKREVDKLDPATAYTITLHRVTHTPTHILPGVNNTAWHMSLPPPQPQRCHAYAITAFTHPLSLCTSLSGYRRMCMTIRVAPVAMVTTLHNVTYIHVPGSRRSSRPIDLCSSLISPLSHLTASHDHTARHAAQSPDL